MFLDKATITIKSGDGGNGAVTFHTEKFVPNGGPDGGDGGKGGDVVFVATSSLNTLTEFKFKRKYFATNGENGGSNKKFGRYGNDVVIYVPVGTVIKDAVTDEIIADMFSDGQKEVVYVGGKGGKGNVHFATPRRQAPHFAQNGFKTLPREVTLELKTIADVGLIGFPNVGKSTLLSVVSNATPKIANYHFTTLSPNLGVVRHYDTDFVMADIPGLIEGAAEGAGLGHSFLRHIERVRMLVHIVDVSGSEHRDPVADYDAINNELTRYSKSLARLPMVVVANKMDLPDAEENLARLREHCGTQVKVFPTMTAIGEGVKPLLDCIVGMLANLPPVTRLVYEKHEFASADVSSYEIIKHDEGIYEVVGGLVNELSRKVYLDDHDSFRYFQKTLVNRGVIDALKQAGMQEGDTVVIADLEFEYME